MRTFRALTYIDIYYYLSCFISDKSNKVICFPGALNNSLTTVLFQVADLPVPFEMILPSSCSEAKALLIVVCEIYG